MSLNIRPTQQSAPQIRRTLQHIAALGGGGGGGGGGGEGGTWTIVGPINAGNSPYQSSLNDFVLCDVRSNNVIINLPRANEASKGGRIGVKLIDYDNRGDYYVQIQTAIQSDDVEGNQAYYLQSFTTQRTFQDGSTIQVKTDYPTVILVSDGVGNWWGESTFNSNRYP